MGPPQSVPGSPPSGTGDPCYRRCSPLAAGRPPERWGREHARARRPLLRRIVALKHPNSSTLTHSLPEKAHRPGSPHEPLLPWQKPHLHSALCTRHKRRRKERRVSCNKSARISPWHSIREDCSQPSRPPLRRWPITVLTGARETGKSTLSRVLLPARSRLELLNAVRARNPRVVDPHGHFSVTDGAIRCHEFAVELRRCVEMIEDIGRDPSVADTCTHHSLNQPGGPRR